MLPQISRRPLLAGLVAAGTGVRAAASTTSQNIKSIDLTDKENLSLIFRKLGYSMDSRLGFWHLSAIRSGLVGTKFTPFWEMHIGRFFTTRDLPDGTYEVTQMGLTYYTDLNTGEFLRRFQNPLTGKTVEIDYGVPKPRQYAPPEPSTAQYELIDARGSEPAGARRPGLSGVGGLGPAWIQGDNIWIQQDHLLEYPSPGRPGAQAHVNDLTTYFGSLTEVADPAAKMPRAGHAFTDVNDWPTWMQMGDQPGAYYSRGVGFKAFSFGEMPAKWKTLALQEHPRIAKDPLKALQAG